MKDPLILLVGWAGRKDLIQPLASLLGEHFEVSVYSVHELSPAADPSDESCSSYASGLLNLLTHNQEPAALLGWSMGGLVALEAAMRNPTLLSRLILVSSTCRFCSDEGYDAGPPVAEVRGLRGALIQAPEAVLAPFFKLVAQPEEIDDDLLQARVEGAMAFGVEALTKGLDYLAETDLRADLPGLDIPTLLLHGSADQIVPPAASGYLATHLKKRALHFLENIGHDLPLHDPDAVANMTMEFVKNPSA